jgi:hypothetical protein
MMRVMPSSAIHIDARGDGQLVLDVPAHATWRRDEAVNLLASGLICLLAGRETEAHLGGMGVSLLQGLILVFLWWLGLAAAIWALDDRTRRWSLKVDEHSLSIQRDGLLGRRVWQWHRRRVVGVEAGVPSVGGTPRLIINTGISRWSLPIGRSAQETHEIALELGRALGLASTSTGPPGRPARDGT